MALINTTTTGIQGSTFYADGTGALTIQQNGQTLGTYGNQPTFSAVPSTTQSISANTWTKVNYPTREWDTNSNYNTSTSRFTPTVAGYYQINAGFNTSTTGAGIVLIGFWKNGSEVRRGGQIWTTTGNNLVPSGSFLIYFNGSTDYIEIYAYATVTNQITGGTNECNFSGVLVRAA